jgi:hypothetical protein
MIERDLLMSSYARRQVATMHLDMADVDGVTSLEQVAERVEHDALASVCLDERFTSLEQVAARVEQHPQL